MYAAEGCLKETVAAVDEFVCCFDEGGAEGVATPPPLILTRKVAKELQDVIFELVRKLGLQKVREAAAKSSAVNEVLHEAVRWHVDGFDR
jgi:hypothetical protein